MATKQSTASTERMPSDPAAKRILHQRAQQLAQQTVDAAKQEPSARFIRVDMGEYGLFDIPKQHTGEIVTSRGMAQVPFAPSHFAGIISLRGEMIAVLDLPAFFGLGSLSRIDNQPILVVSGANLQLGILLIDLDSERGYVAGQLEPTISGGAIASHFVSGIHDGYVTVLDIESLLGDPGLVPGR